MEINNHYNSKLEQFGKDDFRSLNWGDKEGKSAKARYQQMFDQYNWLDKKVLEVGCGWGSFFDFVFTCKEYYGIDINTNLNLPFSGPCVTGNGPYPSLNPFLGRVRYDII